MLPRVTQRSGTVPQTNAQNPQQPSSAWEYYLDMARINDAEQEREITEQVDTQLVFAGLFAAFLSAFLIETLKRLEEDSSATLLDVMIYQTRMMRNETLPPFHREPFTPSPQIVAVNALLFASLMFILVAAIIAMLIKGWIREFDRGLAAIVKARRRALVREYRYLGLERWKFHEIVHFLPALIYLSLFLFFCGLSLFLFNIEKACGSVVTSIFALGAIFYTTTTTISTLDDSAPFRSPLSRALGFQFRRLYNVLLHGTNLWILCLHKATNHDYPRFFGALFYRLARMARWEPSSEAYFSDLDSHPVWDEQDINVADALIERFYKSLPDEGVPGELYQSIVVAGDPAHVSDLWHSYYLLRGFVRSSDQMTLEVARAVGLLICRTDDPVFIVYCSGLGVDVPLPVLAGSRKAWDQLLTCLLQSQLPRYEDASCSLHSSNNHVLEAIRMIKVNPNRMLFVVRFLASRVSPDAEPEEKAAAVRILSTILSQIVASPLYLSSDQLVHAILYVFIVINGIPFPDADLNSPLSKLPSFPHIAYNTGVLSQILNPTQWCSQGASVIPVCREFGRALIDWILVNSTYRQLDARVLHELPRSRLEEYALLPPSDSCDGSVLAYLLLEALISDSEIPRSEFPALEKNNISQDGVLNLYDSYLIQCGATPSVHLQNLLSLRDELIYSPESPLEVHHPWLALHTYTLMRQPVPHELIPALKWSDTPALDMIVCDRLKLYDGLPKLYGGRSDELPEPALLTLFLSSTAYETVLKAFKWHLTLTTRPYYMHQEQYCELPTTLAFDRIIPILFGSTLDENQMISSWALILDSLVLPWPCLPIEMKRGLVREFFRPEIDIQNPSSNERPCLGVSWIEKLWSTVLASLVGAVYIEDVTMVQDHWEPFDRNTGWSGPVEIEAEVEWLDFVANERRRIRREKEQQERAQRNRLLRSVDDVLSVLATLLEAAHGAGLLSLEAVAHLQGSPLLLDPRLLQDATSVQVINTLIEYYRPCLCPLPDTTPDEAEVPLDAHAIDPTN